MFSFNSQPSSMVQAFKKHRDCWTTPTQHWQKYFKQTQYATTKLVPFLLSGLFRKQTQIWWLSVGSDADNGRKSSFLRYSLTQVQTASYTCRFKNNQHAIQMWKPSISTSGFWWCINQHP